MVGLIGSPIKDNHSEFRGARVHLTANEASVDASSADFPISWDAAPIDTDGFWSGGSPTRLTIPAGLGITHVELVGSVNMTGATAEYTNLAIRQRNSGGTLLFAAANVEGAVTAKLINVATGPVAVSAGDYFTLDIKTTTDTSITLQAATYFTSLALRVVGFE